MCFWHYMKKTENKTGQVLKDEKNAMNVDTTRNITESIHLAKNEKDLQESTIRKVNLSKDKITRAKQYIVQKSPKNKRKWEVILRGGSKVLKLFNTEVEASEYARVTAKNQGASVLKRASKGEKKGKFIP